MRGDGAEGREDGRVAIKPVCLTPDVPLVTLAQTIVVWNLRNAFDRLARVNRGWLCETTTKKPPWAGAREMTEGRSRARRTDQRVSPMGHFNRKISDKIRTSV